MKKQLLLKALLALFYALVANQTIKAQISFAPYTNYIITPNTRVDHVATGDFNNDGRSDVATATGYIVSDTTDYKLYVYLQDSLGGLQNPAVYNYSPVYSGLRTMASGDVNNDGLTDIVICFSDSIAIFYQNSFGTLDSAQNLAVATNSGHYAHGVKIGDVNNDSYMDIAVSKITDPSLRVFYGDSLGQLTYLDYPAISSGGTKEVDIVKLGTDTFNSVVLMRTSGGNPYLSTYHILPDKTLDTLIDYSISGNPAGMGTGDINGDGVNELLLSNVSYGFSGIGAWSDLSQPNPDTMIDPPTTFTTRAIEVQDLDCDGSDEIITSVGSADVIILSDSSINQLPVVNITSATSIDYISIADMNSDGRQDIVLANGYGGILVFLNNTQDTSSTISIGSTFMDTLLSNIDTLAEINYDTAANVIVMTIDTLFISTYVIDSITPIDSIVVFISPCGDTVYAAVHFISDTLFVGSYPDTIQVSYSDTIWIANVLGPQKNKIGLYPNPSWGAITILFETPLSRSYEFALYSTLGKGIFRQELSAVETTLQIPISVSGVYVCTISDGIQMVHRQKVVFIK